MSQSVHHPDTFFFKWKIAVRNFGFSPYSWLIHIALIGKCELKKKKWREKLCRIFWFVSRLDLVVRNSRKIFQSYWKVKIIIIIICDDEHNPSFLNDDDYFQMMSWRSSFCDLQNFLRQLFFFKEKELKTIHVQAMKINGLLGVNNDSSSSLRRILKKKKTNLHFKFILVRIYFLCPLLLSRTLFYTISPPPFDFCIGNGPFVTFHVTVVSLVLGRKVKVICFLSLSSIVKGEHTTSLNGGAKLGSFEYILAFRTLPVVSLYI